MKVVKTDKEYYKEPIFPFKETCEKCGSVIEIESYDDLHVGALGCYYYDCPVCDKENMADHVDGITLTIDNLEFPVHFYDFKNGKEVSKDEIKEYIKKGVLKLRKNKAEDDCGMFYTATGDTFVLVKRYPGDEEYCVMVAKGYYHTNIPFQQEDYNPCGGPYDD